MAAIQTTVYNAFLGVDKASPPSEVSPSRSPDAPNLIPDADSFPEKRPGWRVLASVEAPVNGIFPLTLSGANGFLVHGGTRLYSWQGGTDAPVQLYTGVTSAKSAAFTLGDALYLLTGGEYLRYDGQSVTDMTAAPFVPTLRSGDKPDGTGGALRQSRNLLTGKARATFLADGSTAVYRLPETEISSVVSVTVGGAALSSGFSADLTAGTVTFDTAPAAPENAGEDNVAIVWEKTAAASPETITGCRICTLYGYGAFDRAVVSGNPSLPHCDWISAGDDPSYFPESGVQAVGGPDSAVMGYALVGGNLAILKEPFSESGSVFFRSGASLDGETVFPVTQAACGSGMIARGTVAALGDEPLFLTQNGVCAITADAVTDRTGIRNRSRFVDPALLREENLSEAAAAVWQNRYLLCVPGEESHAYLLDGSRTRSYLQEPDGYVCECFTWDNIPARVLCARGEALYFGTDEGLLCRFNNDIGNMTRYSDGGSETLGEDGEPSGYLSGGTAIDARWTTRADDDGDFMREKTLLKRGCGVLLMPFARSGAKISLRDDYGFSQQVADERADIFSWENLDFSRLSFNSADTPRVVPFRARVRRYRTLTITVRNDSLNEGFGVLGIVKRFVKGGLAR